MDNNDSSQLTEFPRFESESNQSGVTMFFNKLWKLPLFSPNESDDHPEDKMSRDDKYTQLEDPSKKEVDLKNDPSCSQTTESGRNVMRKISVFSSGSGTRYADTDLARYWMPDDISRECYECAARFGALRRRHHCRVCGQIFCSRCCSQRVPGQIFGCAGDLRVCTYCCNVVLSYLRENDITGEIYPDLRMLQENLQTKFPEKKSNSTGNRDFMFAREQENCEVQSSTKDIHDIYRQLSFSLPTQHHRYRLVRYSNVWRGCDVIQWVMENTPNKTRAQASMFCQSLLQQGYMEQVTDPPHFADYGLYRPLNLVCTEPDVSTDENNEEAETTRLVESVSSYCLDLNLGDSSARLRKSTKREPAVETPEEEPLVIENDDSSEVRPICKAIEESGVEHIKLLLRQCLARQALCSSWADVLYPLCVHAANITAPDLMGADIDVRNYVQVKKVPGGEKRDSVVVPGVVISKNVVHRGMPRQITNPTVLLLDCSIAYQRVEGKLTSLEPVLMQEQEYLVRCAARISALRPRVVLVKGGVARGVQDALREQGVALAIGVRDRTLRRVSRCARADLVASIDARIGMPKLGTCKNFSIKNYSSKTLMVLEGCAEPNLGCCILLRGGTQQELTRVKKVAKFILLACYNWKLEKAFLGDIEAVLPEPGMSFIEEPIETKTVEKDIEVGEAVLERIKTNGSDDSDIFDGKISYDIKVEESKVDSDVKDEENDQTNESETKIEFKENEDPVRKQYRKMDSDKNLSCGVPIKDFSDPLRSTVSMEDDVFLPVEAEFKADTKAERWCTDDVVLSMSPNIVIPAPPRPIRPQPPHTPRELRHQVDSKPVETQFKEPHPFVKQAITAPADDLSVRRMLANFRATGCRLVADKHKPECPKYSPSVVKPVLSEVETNKKKESESLDPLDPENHQRLSLLLYSYCNKSPNVPDFCVNPWIVTMEMYGRHDISLGAFLEKYCFNPDHKCPSPNCHVPMNQHIRRFVHGDVCITITCNTIGHSNVDKTKEDQNKQVMFWSRCEACGIISRGVPLSRSALGLSLAQYVRQRVAAPRYGRKLCAHPLNKHSHAFVTRLTTACFRYNKIKTYDIQLPPDVISIDYDTKQMRDSLIAHLNELMLKGHETLSVGDGDAEREYSVFKQHMEQIHLALTAPAHSNTSLTEVVRRLWNVYDNIITGEKMLRDAQDKLSPNTKNKVIMESNVEDRTDSEDSAGDSSNEINLDVNLEKEHIGTEEEEERGDKKTVKQILSQLLTNNQPSNQTGMIISSGVLPVLVKAGEIGSVIAATLASVTYQLSLQQHKQRHSTQSELEDDLTSSKDKVDGDKAKAKSNDHIEVLLKDGLICRVYYAVQFHKLRHMLLANISGERAESGDENKCCDPLRREEKETKGVCEIEEGFIRSLAHCVPWATRGGKSGSTFCKTKDDRYVLKEMTKPEWQQFLEFAPHYFNYVTSCRANGSSSLLARILGVFSVGGAGSGVLVIEHVWYGPTRGDMMRFDLKGAARHRLATGAASMPPNQAVLVDDNLLALRWDRQLYVESSTGSKLWASLERDTSFLAQHHVMDYSLLLGIQDDTLVLGIIDYIRTFTWDKKLEHLVKKNLGSGQPTVVSPEQYKRRFCAAARKYFLQCPEHWHQLNDTKDV
ncbi:1-phosphatidylinositol 3-phosphate 5-kinase isoform X1 [Pieris napi]|uniref:1-phosphatidylinositol 3-phosphate 5-kinase isoform X1 n=1 Tax=Pieris napi TaxID=78633 RepID=UPI001FBA7643|nr:1-phosphatidylinositol 3-phosphate 5-kinase isoform X1 [Pieris napi]XP_047516726.1 1-phosphatidylinositol 3-phosphate 5-kinase isoform X1 [Pieris napi]